MTAAPAGNAPSWLFSFVDLAFLLLIAMTQVGGSPDAVEVRGIVLPRLRTEAAAEPVAPAVWQVRIHPAHDAAQPPFELARGDSTGERLTDSDLGEALRDLRARGERKPLLAPDADSRSRDLLEAAARVEGLWPERRQALIERPRRAR